MWRVEWSPITAGGTRLPLTLDLVIRIVLAPLILLGMLLSAALCLLLFIRIVEAFVPRYSFTFMFLMSVIFSAYAVLGAASWLALVRELRQRIVNLSSITFSAGLFLSFGVAAAHLTIDL